MANTWLTAPQAARLVGLAPFSLHRMAKRGELRYQRLGRLWLFERREIARLKRMRVSGNTGWRGKTRRAHTFADTRHAAHG